MDKKNNAKLIRLKIRMKIAAKRKKTKALMQSTIKPVYDEVFFEGLKWLNSL